MSSPFSASRLARALWIGCAAALFASCGSHPEPRRLTIAYTNDLRGEIRSCGCAVKDYGGLGRRATFLAALRDSSQELLLLDGGDIFASGLNYGREKADLTLKAMARMGYHAVVPGEMDFSFGVDYLVKRAREVGVPLLAANLFDAAGDTLVLPATLEATLPSGLRVGLTGAMSRKLKLPRQVPAGSLVVRDPITTLRPIVDSLRTRADLVVVLLHMPRGEAARVAGALPGTDVVVHGHEGPALRAAPRAGNTFVLQVPDRGRYLGVARATLGEDGRIASLAPTAVPLDESIADDEAIAKLFQAYDLDIASREKLSQAETSPAPAKDRFVGAVGCRSCHAELFDQWSSTEHAHAFETLSQRNRQLDRDCTPCHSTGFYKAGGFVSAMATPELSAVQCESCHGNAARHARDPRVKTGGDPRAACRECHTVEQTPDFEFERYWARLSNCSKVAAASGSP